MLSPAFDRKPGIGFKLRGDKGIEARHIAHRDAAAYKTCRKTAWGDLFPISTEESATEEPATEETT